MLANSTDILGDRLERLENMVERGFEKVQASIEALDLRVRRMETNESGCKIAVDYRLSQAIQDVAALKARLDLAEKDIEFLMPWVRGLRWAVGLLGAAVASLIWGLLTGHIDLIMR